MKKSLLCILFMCLFSQAFAADLNGTWYTGSNNGIPSLSDPSSNSFVWGTDGTSATASKGSLWSYFPDMTLANDGDAITLSFTVTPLDATATTQSIRFGLFNDGGTQVLNNLNGTNSDSGFLSTMGYFSKWNTGYAIGQLVARTAGKTNPCSDSSDVDNLTETASGPAVTLTQGIAYDMTFSLTRNSVTEYLVASSVDDGTFVTLTEATTTNINATAFNTFFMLLPPAGIDSLEFANIRVAQNETAWDPTPGNGDVGVLTADTLSWKTGLGDAGTTNTNITKHYVYMVEAEIGADPNWLNATMATETTAVDPTGVTPPVTLQMDKTYYWRVDESVLDSASTGDPNTIVGNVWEFETQLSFPTIDTGPVDTAVFPTETATFTVEFASVSPVTNNQWFKSTDLGVTWNEVTTGITLDEASTSKTSTLMITSAGELDEALYYCNIANSIATVDSDVAGLAVKRRVAYYAFEDNLSDGVYTGTNDGTAKNTDPNLTADIAYADGVDGRALLVNPTADPNPSYVELPMTAYPKAGPGGAMEAGTIMCWIKKSQLNSKEAVMGNFNEGGNTGFGFTSETGLSKVLVRGEGGTSQQKITYSEIELDKWYFIAVRWELGDTVRGYIGSYSANGIGSTISTSATSATYVPWENPLYIGGTNSRGVLVDAISNGMIDDLMIYNYALTDAEIAAAYNAISGNSLCVYDYLDAYDFDNDCTVGLTDFAMIAEVWLSSGLSNGN